MDGQIRQGEPVNAFAANWGSDGVLYLSGELDLASEDDILAALRERTGQPNGLVIDLSRLAFLDSTGIRAFAHVATGPGAARVLLRSPEPFVQRVLELAGVASWPNVTVEHP